MVHVESMVYLRHFSSPVAAERSDQRGLAVPTTLHRRCTDGRQKHVEKREKGSSINVGGSEMASWVMERSHYPEEHEVYGQHAPLLLDDHEPRRHCFAPQTYGCGDFILEHRGYQNGRGRAGAHEN